MAVLCDLDEISTDLGCFPNDPIGFAGQFYSIGLALVGAVALIAIIIGGYTIMSSQGDPRRVRAGKSWIFYAIGGLLLAIFGYVIIETIAGGILVIPGFS